MHWNRIKQAEDSGSKLATGGTHPVITENKAPDGPGGHFKSPNTRHHTALSIGKVMVGL